MRIVLYDEKPTAVKEIKRSIVKREIDKFYGKFVNRRRNQDRSKERSL